MRNDRAEPKAHAPFAIQGKQKWLRYEVQLRPKKKHGSKTRHYKGTKGVAGDARYYGVPDTYEDLVHPTGGC
jgi:hypothetical protein